MYEYFKNTRIWLCLNALVNEINIERTIIFLKSEVERLQQEKESLKKKTDIQQQLDNCEAKTRNSKQVNRNSSRIE